MFFMTYRIIHRSISALRIEEVTISYASVQSEPLVTRVERVLRIYQALVPFLTGLASIPLIPPTWRAALIVFLQALDHLAAGIPSSTPAPAIASAAADTTTDPLGTDPSFKAGKDL